MCRIAAVITSVRCVCTHLRVQADFEMVGSPKPLRVTWQFYELTINGPSQYQASKERGFALDQLYFDHFNFAPSEVAAVALTFVFGV